MADYSVELPKLYEWKVGSLYNFKDQIVSFESLEELDTALNAARHALFVVTDKINEYERKERKAKLEYDRACRQEYITSQEKTDAAKRIRAEIKCEDLENEWVRYDQLKKELVRTSATLRLELETLQTMGHNLRQQLKMI